MQEFAPFWRVTEEAHDFAMVVSKPSDPTLRQKLAKFYLQLKYYPEVQSVPQTLKRAGKYTVICSNSSRGMLALTVENSSLGDSLHASLSVDDVGVSKADPRVYKMATDHFNCTQPEICFMSSNAWDAWAASHFGFQVAWVNRFGQPPEHMPGGPAAEITTLEELPPLLGL